MRTTFLNELTSEEIKEIMNSQSVVFLGSTISSFPPTSLLSGRAFCENMYEYIFNGSFQTGEYTWVKEEFNNMPFEALMECFPKQEELRDIIKEMFHKEESNQLHQCFAQNLVDGNFSALITPNYDLAFDAFLKSKYYDEQNIIRNEEEYNNFISQKRKGAYFKIHGTAEDGYESTLIYTLSQESIFEKWKADFLSELLSEKILIFIGYSGRDFDICPVIADIKKYTYKKIIWLKRGNPLTAYAEFLISKKDENQIVIGDIIDFANRFFETNISLEIGSSSPVKFFTLTDTERLQWQINILSRMSCASLGFELLNSYRNTLPEEFVKQIEFEMNGHTGEYQKAEKAIREILKGQKKNSKEYILSMSSLSGNLLSSGGYLRCYFYLLKGVRKAKRYYPHDLRMRGIFLNRRVTNLMNIYQITNSWWPLRILSFLIRKRAKWLKKVNSDVMLTASWDEKQRIQHSFERLKLNDEMDIPLPAQKGYENLGLAGMDIIAYRDTVRYRKNIVEEQDIERLKLYIEKAKQLGMKTETWKLCRILIKKTRLRKEEKLNYWREWKKYLSATEYYFPRIRFERLDLNRTYWHLKNSK